MTRVGCILVVAELVLARNAAAKPQWDNGPVCPSWDEVLIIARADLLSPGGPTRHPWEFCNGLDDCEGPSLDANEWLSPLAIAEWADHRAEAAVDVSTIRRTRTRGLTEAAIAAQLRVSDESAAEKAFTHALELILIDGTYPDPEHLPGRVLETIIRQFSSRARLRLIGIGWQRLQIRTGSWRDGLGPMLARLTVDLEPAAVERRLRRLLGSPVLNSDEFSETLRILVASLFRRDETALQAIVDDERKKELGLFEDLRVMTLSEMARNDFARTRRELQQLRQPAQRLQVETDLARMLTDDGRNEQASILIAELKKRFPFAEPWYELEYLARSRRRSPALVPRTIEGTELAAAVFRLAVGSGDATVSTSLCVDAVLFEDRAQAEALPRATLDPSFSRQPLLFCPETLEDVVAIQNDPGRAITLALSPQVPDVAPALIRMYLEAHPGVFPDRWSLPSPMGRLFEPTISFAH